MTLDARKVLNELLVDIFNQILVIEERYHRVHGIKLSMTEVHTLESITKSESRTMGDVASLLRITQGTLTTNVNRLTHKGYVYRTQDDQDRRIYRLGLTEKGEAVMAIHNQFHEEMVERLLLYINDGSELVEAVARINVFFKDMYEI